MDSNYESIIGELIEGTNFEISKESQVLTSSQLRVRTPIEVINCLLGGGLPLNGIYHTWGPPKGGKSTWLYQTMGNFQEQYPDGIAIILDMESSADPDRLASLGVNTSKVLRLPTTSIESGFLALFKFIENKQKNKKLVDLPMFVIWDTISRGLATDGSTQSRMNAQDRARIIKNYMPDLSSRIEKQPFILGLINQVVYEVDRYGNRHSNAGGGIALQHDNHMSVYIEQGVVNYDQSGSLAVSQWSKLNIDKSKLSPVVANVPFKIDITKGGVVDEKASFFGYMLDTLCRVNKLNSGWYSFDTLANDYEGSFIGEYIAQHNKKFRYDAILEYVINDDIMYDILRYDFIQYIKRIYTLQGNIMKDYSDEIYNRLKSILVQDEDDDQELAESEMSSNDPEKSIEDSIEESALDNPDNGGEDNAEDVQ